MKFYIGIALLIAFADVLVAAAAWKVLSGSMKRPRYARDLGAILGAAAGAWLAEPQVAHVYRQMGYIQEAAAVANMLTYPFVQPASIAALAWLSAETIGGRSSRPLFSATLAFAAAYLSGALVFLPIFFVDGADTVISPSVILAIPAIGTALALVIMNRYRGRASSRPEGL
jgi:hypothetical protein